jgi:hypothetical protein
MPPTPDASPAQAMRPDGHEDADVRRSSRGKDKPNVDTPIYALQQDFVQIETTTQQKQQYCKNGCFISISKNNVDCPL